MTLSKEFTDPVREWAVANPTIFCTGPDRRRLEDLYIKFCVKVDGNHAASPEIRKKAFWSTCWTRTC